MIENLQTLQTLQNKKMWNCILTRQAQILYNIYRCESATRDRGGIGIRARLRGVSDEGTGSSPVDRTNHKIHQLLIEAGGSFICPNNEPICSRHAFLFVVRLRYT